MFQLRYYQEKLVQAALGEWEKHQSTAIISATGTGKTEMYLSLAVSDPGRVLVLVHRDYLISQPIDRLARVGFTDVAVEKAEQRAEGRLRGAKVVFASVQSISQPNRLTTFNPSSFSLVIVDEGHRATSPSYRRVIKHFQQNIRCKILILTATPNRKDGVALSNVCDSVAGVYGPAAAMAEGWIVPVKFYRRDVQSLDFSKVRLKGSDLDPQQVQDLLLVEEPLHEVCASLSQDTGPTIVFCPEVAIAHAYSQMMNRRYRPDRSVMLYADSPDEERETAGKRLAQGEIDWIFNVGLYTEGYDLPFLLRCVWASPTASLVRYTQGTGRVFRPHPSLRSHLTGGPEESARRRQLIEQSPKPFGVVVTYYPQNCQHELCDPVDILGGSDLPPDVKAAARQVQQETSRQGGGSSTEEDLETARIFCDLKAVLEEKRRQIKATAQVADHQFDPMSGRKRTLESKPVREVGAWPPGDPPTEKQLGWLRWKGVPADKLPTVTKWQASVVRDLFEMGVGLDVAMGYGQRQALKVRDEMRSKKVEAGGAA